VSNFQPVDLEAILKVCRYKPVCNQCEFQCALFTLLCVLLTLKQPIRPGTPRAGPRVAKEARHPHGRLRTSHAHCAKHALLLPVLMRTQARGVEGPLNPLLTQLAERLSTSQPHPASAATVLLKWQKALGNLAICMSTREERILNLARTDDFRDLTPEEVDEVSRVGKTAYFRYYDTLMVKDFPVSDAIQAKALKGGAFKLKV
jgi:diketogulonate reductase-like aldo/keto reductase